MFPTRYFAATYWPASYFPDPAAVPPVDVSRSRLADIVNAIKRKLVADSVVPDACCLSILEDEPFPTPGGPFVSVIAGVQYPSFPDVEGGGRYLATFLGDILVRLYMRNTLDKIPEDSVALYANDPTIGIYVLSKRVLASLLTYLPADEQGHLLVESALVFGAINRPTRYRQDRSYLRLEIPIRIEYYEPLTGDEDYQTSYSP